MKTYDLGDRLRIIRDLGAIFSEELCNNLFFSEELCNNLFYGLCGRLRDSLRDRLYSRLSQSPAAFIGHGLDVSLREELKEQA